MHKNCPMCGHRLRAPLSPTQVQIAALVAEGAHLRDITEARRSSMSTVKNQLQEIYRKLGIDPRDKSGMVKLAVYMNCELFQIGLKELGVAA